MNHTTTLFGSHRCIKLMRALHRRFQRVGRKVQRTETVFELLTSILVSDEFSLLTRRHAAPFLWRQRIEIELPTIQSVHDSTEPLNVTADWAPFCWSNL